MTMRVPRSLLRQRIVVEDYVGEGAHGPLFDPGRTVRARVEGARRTVRRVQGGSDVGTDIITSAVAYVRPEVTPPPNLSRVTHAGRSYTVVDVIDGEGQARPSHRELLLS